MGLARKDELSYAADDRWSPQAYLTAKHSQPLDSRHDWRASASRLPHSQLDAPSWSPLTHSEPYQRTSPLIPGAHGQVGESWGAVRPLAHSGASTAGKAPLTEERRFHEPATPFIGKLHHLLTQPAHAHLIRWSASGDAFVFRGEDPRLSKLFERVWRTGQVKSFVRQLSMSQPCLLL